MCVHGHSRNRVQPSTATRYNASQTLHLSVSIRQFARLLLTLCIIQPSLSQLSHPLCIIHCNTIPKPVAPHSTPSDKPRTITSRLNISPIISLLPNMFPYCLQFSAPSLMVNSAVPSQKRVKNPWNGESALSAFWRSKAVNCRVNTRSLNLLLRFFAPAGSFSYTLH